VNLGFNSATRDFALHTASATKILIVEVAGLGDLVHSLPAMAAIRETYPRAELHCLVRREYASLLRLAPWIDRVWPYERGRSLNPRTAWNTTRALRAERFAIAIDLMGSDHASTAAWLSGAPRRLVRRPGRVRSRYAWRWFGTDVIEFPFGQEAMYLQRWRCLQQAGIRSAEPVFDLLPAPSIDAVLGAEGSRPPYVHLSPYTKLACKELAPTQTAEVLERLCEAQPGLRVAISCPDRPRDRRALEALLRSLSFVPWRVFAGTLDVPQLHAVIEGAALHLGGDTASMHLAWLAGTPSVCWMSAFANHRTWAPRGDRHAMVYSTVPPGRYLFGVPTESIVVRAVERLRGLEKSAAAVRADGASRPSALHLHHPLHRHHVVIEVGHDPERAEDEQHDNQQAERQRHDVVDAVGPRREVQEEDQVHAHLRERQHRERDRDAGLPDQRAARDVERDAGQQSRQRQADEVAANRTRDVSGGELVAGGDVAVGFVKGGAHRGATPTR
jgi:ADP-heptose:LPS heptosyltransferase